LSVMSRDAAHAPRASPQHDANNMEREYKFFVTTQEPHQPEGTERELIRRLVMRNFFEAKWSGPTKETSELNSASTVQAKPNLKSRFRLPKPGQEIKEAKAKPRNKTTERKASQDDMERKTKATPPARRLANSQTNGSESSRSSPSSPGNRKALSDEKDGKKGVKVNVRVLLKTNPSTHRFDPFDVLPVPGTPQLDVLFKLSEYFLTPYGQSIYKTAHATFVLCKRGS